MKIEDKENELSENAIKLYNRLYISSVLGEKTPTDVHRRIAKFVASSESTPEDRELWEKVFFKSLECNEFRPNSPTMMNAGVFDKPQTSACFVGDLKDSLKSIFDFDREAGMIYAEGSGVGINYGVLREMNASLSSGGASSGPFAFMKKLASTAEAVKSGGKCLAPKQPVLTEKGVKTAEDLYLANKSFIIMSFDRCAGRYKAKKASCFKSGEKTLFSLETDKGVFHLTGDHPVLLTTGEYIEVSELKYGMSIQPCSVFRDKNDYLRVNLYDGRGSKEKIHRLVMMDIMNEDLDPDMDIHHINGDKSNNSPENLKKLSKSDHISIHVKKQISEGIHSFTNNKYPKSGDKNGMHHLSSFWKDEGKVKEYKEKQSSILLEDSSRPVSMALQSHKAQMIKRTYDLINSGFLKREFGFEDLLSARRRKWGKSGSSKKIQMDSIVKYFGNFESFKQSISDNNHCVISIKEIGLSPVFDIQVECESLYDRSNGDNHNFVICPIGTEGHTSTTGIVIHNSRRAAHMAMMSDTHPDLETFIKLKDGVDQTYSSMNLSVAASDKFMEAVMNDEKWDLIGVNDKEVKRTLNAEEIFDKIIDNAYKCGDPGIWFIDKANADNTLKNIGDIVTTNPCGEQCLLPHQACSLGSINLNKCLSYDDKGEIYFDYYKLMQITKIVTRFLDNCIDISGYPTPDYERMAKETRPMGLGFMGLADIFLKLGIPYNSNDASDLGRRISLTMTSSSIQYSIELSKIRGPFKEYQSNKDHVKRVIEKFINKNDKKHYDSLMSNLDSYGIRNSQWTTIAPTGSTSLSCDCSQGMEPLFGLCYEKTLSDTNEVMTFVHGLFEEKYKDEPWYEDSVPLIAGNNGSCHSINIIPEEVRELWVCAHDIKWEDRIDMQSALQSGISNSISSTINLPQDISKEVIKDIYFYAWKMGCKGITIYRDKSLDFQPVTFGKKEAQEVSAIPLEKKVKKRRYGSTHEVKTGHGTVYFTINSDEDGNPIEVFTSGAKNGSVNAANLEALGRLFSIALQNGTPMEKLAKTIENINDGTIAWDKIDENDKKPVSITSIPDALGKILRRFYVKENIENVFTIDSYAVESKEEKCEICKSPVFKHDGCIFCPQCGSKCG